MDGPPRLTTRATKEQEDAMVLRKVAGCDLPSNARFPWEWIRPRKTDLSNNVERWMALKAAAPRRRTVRGCRALDVGCLGPQPIAIFHSGSS